MNYLIGNNKEYVTDFRRGRVYVSEDVSQALIYDGKSNNAKLLEILSNDDYRKFYIFDDFAIDERVFKQIFNSSTTVTENEVEGVLDAFDIVDFDRIVFTYLDETAYTVTVFHSDGTIENLM